MSDKICKCKNFYEEVIPSYSFSTFKSHFRMTPSAFEFILNAIAICPEFIKRGREFGGHDQINAEKALLITIWTLATPESYRSIGDRFNVSKYSVFICLHTVVGVIVNHLCRLFIKWPAVNERNEVAASFARYGLENVIGAIDGCHIPIKKPVAHGIDYFNRKKFYSVVLQGICKHNLMFTDVDVRWPGSVHDARVFRTSEIYPRGSQLCAPDFYIIGDAAYPCKNWVMTPFINNGHLTQAQIYFNTQLSKTRVKIENTFALLKGRFRRLKELLDMNDIANINRTILACCVLHNICIFQGDDDIEQYIIEGLQNVNLLDNFNVGNQNDRDERGLQQRNILMEQLWNRHQNNYPNN